MKELKEKTIGDLSKAPDEIRSCAMAFDGVDNKLQLLQEYMKTRRASQIIEIDAEMITDGKGKEKKKYSNEASRNAELTKRLDLNEETKDSKLNIEALQKKKAVIVIDLQYARDRFSASKAIARILDEKE